ncbi:MAG: ABC transporter ATP-binding protein [Bacteroidetes bacterium]|nr:MAG: ABC transporter ATP-binding protein [Bacteroidota bacterium]REK05768.1 MAG: ABC transporter ATP-binding protein [Bacteroidota bacterium]REK31926.1 MAG: ABC transporter ATP-binding protein [Bacteroidota bacterium]REK49991.1 MAG: ABC transporter ATP-binding protein [Bacteroidota bacterium]
MSNKEKLLSVKNLSTEFLSGEGIHKAVKGISFDLHKGETLGLVGESGSGKSVTSLSLMRLIGNPGKISGGSVIYSERDDKQTDLLSLPEKEMRKYRGKELAMIFQEPMTSLNPVLTCGYQVAEAIMIHNRVSKTEAREDVLKLFRKVELPRPEQMFDAYPHQLSGGQKQRVMIAMAISCKPQVLIADEPTTALDVTVQATILKLLKNLQQETGMSLIFITHDLGVISEIADRVLVMYQGNIVEQGAIGDIFMKPAHPYTRGLLACRPRPDRKLRVLPVLSDFMKVDAEGKFSEKIFNETEELKKLELSPEQIIRERNKIYSGSPVLEVKNLSTWFPVRKGLFGKTKDYVKAVDDVSFNVYPGETLGLVGESGCGKTTLGRSIIRLVEPSSGQVIFRGYDFAGLRGKALRQTRKHIQIIFQDPYSSLNPRMTIGNAILEPMEVHRMHDNYEKRRMKVFELLEKVGLQADHFNRYPHEFSGGQRQRICIARALALEPQFIICDESVSALDVSVQAQVLNLLTQLKKDFGLTYIFISHDLSVVKFMSDKLIVMNKGKIEEAGYPEEIYANPKSDYTKKLISAIPGMKKDFSGN